MIGAMHKMKRRGFFVARPAGVLVVLFILAACGGGSGAPPPEMSGGPPPLVEPGAALPPSAYVPWTEDEVHATLLPENRDEAGVPSHLWVDPAFPPGIRYEPYLDASIYHDLAPVMTFGSTLHVGADVAPPRRALESAGARGGVALSRGVLRDGTPEAEVLAYLRQVASGGGGQLRTWIANPTLFVVGSGTGGRYLGLTRAAGRILNAARAASSSRTSSGMPLMVICTEMG